MCLQKNQELGTGSAFQRDKSFRLEVWTSGEKTRRGEELGLKKFKRESGELVKKVEGDERWLSNSIPNAHRELSKWPYPRS